MRSSVRIKCLLDLLHTLHSKSLSKCTHFMSSTQFNPRDTNHKETIITLAQFTPVSYSGVIPCLPECTTVAIGSCATSILFTSELPFTLSGRPCLNKSGVSNDKYTLTMKVTSWKQLISSGDHHLK